MGAREREVTEWLTTDEVAAHLRMASSTVIRLIKAGEIPAKRFGRQWRILAKTVAAWEQAAS